jgi:hypothetical protein
MPLPESDPKISRHLVLQSTLSSSCLKTLVGVVYATTSIHGTGPHTTYVSTFYGNANCICARYTTSGNLPRSFNLLTQLVSLTTHHLLTMFNAMHGPIMVFGGNGALGSHVIDALHADASFSLVITASRRPKPIQCLGSSTLYRDTICRTCDISDSAQIEALLDDIKPQTIISCAAPKSTASDATQYQTHYVGTIFLLECACRHPIV